jgi:hypothetical protein
MDSKKDKSTDAAAEPDAAVAARISDPPPKEGSEPSFSDDEFESKGQLAGSKRSAEDDGGNVENFSARKLEQRRAYNRKCAAKARKRSKDLIAHLQAQVEDLSKDKTELQRSNDVMRAQLDLLESQNRTLMTNQQRQPMAAAPQPVSYGQAPPYFMGAQMAGGYPSGNLQLLDALAAGQGRMQGMPPNAGGQTPQAGMDAKYYR